MSRTGTDAETFAQDLREMAGDGSIDWVYQPFQASALLDIADMLDENAKLKAEGARLRKLCGSLFRLANNECLSDTRRCDDCPMSRSESPCVLSLDFIAMRELGIDVTPWEVERVEVEQ